MASTVDWLRGRDDAALVELLRARPDLAVPAPTDLSVLGRRLDTPPSVWRVLEGLDRFAVQVLEAVVLLGGHGHHPREMQRLTPTALAEFLGPGASADDVRRVLHRLEALALVRGTDPTVISSAVPAALGEYPGGFGPPGKLTGSAVADALAAATPEELTVLNRLAAGRPRGSVVVGGPNAAVVATLVEAGLLLRTDPGTVVLPREVGLALRGPSPLGELHPQIPAGPLAGRGVKVVDGTAAGQALETVALVHRLLDSLGRTPAPVLKSGGMGIRELRRIAKVVDLDLHLTALYVELLAATGLLATTEPRMPTAVNAFTPTDAADVFTALPPEEAWTQLVTVWLDLRRDPARTGQRDVTDKVLTALSAELSWVRGPADRRFVLKMLGGLPPGTGIEGPGLADRLAWSAPLRTPERRDEMAANVLLEATALGVVAFSALSSAGRALLADDQPGAAAALAAALPEPVATVMIQADLTVVAPGRLQPELAARLAAAADVESAGSATVYRVTPDSLRRAFDGGASTADLHELFGRHSVTGVPQGLTYLIDDVARRHGVLRAGVAGSYLRSEDPALIEEAVAQAGAAGILVRRLAPTVAISTSRVEDLLHALRGGGLVPAAEDAGGAVVDLRPAPLRTRGSLTVHQRRREPALPSDDQLTALIHRMRSADRAPGERQPQTPAQAIALLRYASDHRGSVWIGYVDSEGGTSRRMIEPIAVSGGAVAAFDRLRDQVRTFALHRITDVAPIAPER